jgi:hypothetical protein
MAEFARLLPPGGHLLISTNGEKYLKNREMPRSLVQRFRAGELVVLYPELNQSFETYGACDVYHPESWVRKHLTRHFACVDYAANDFGDYYLFRKD